MTAEPFIDPIAKREIEKIIRSSKVRPFDIFEWGSGGSTLWLAEFNVGTVFSVEHDPKWYTQLLREIIRLDVKNVDLRLVPANY